MALVITQSIAKTLVNFVKIALPQVLIKRVNVKTIKSKKQEVDVMLQKSLYCIPQDTIDKNISTKVYLNYYLEY